ncbi:helix-turn-helix transcriptional regulator [Acinetobacter sp. KS-LM10]|uniref:helix-turn-helix transcriptional regulator n=1 Tax=Acinetobacter sp. KS-LM10 TaxID=3120518 RepID=UPI0030D04C94
MKIDRRVRASEFMRLMSVGRTKFYRMIQDGEVPAPVRLSDKEVFWYESIVKKEVEKFKPKGDIVACS